MGDRVFAQVGPLELEFGGQLDQVTVAYETWGTLAPDGSNAVLVLHALTGDSHVVGESNDAHPTPGWWDGLIGPHSPLDSDRWFVVAPNVLGGCQGTTVRPHLQATAVHMGRGFRALRCAIRCARNKHLPTI